MKFQTVLIFALVAIAMVFAEPEPEAEPGLHHGAWGHGHALSHGHGAWGHGRAHGHGAWGHGIGHARLSPGHGIISHGHGLGWHHG